MNNLNRKGVPPFCDIRMEYPKCNWCKSNLVTAYISDTAEPNRQKKAIGKICVNCDVVRDTTKFFNELKSKVQKKFKEKEESKPIFDPTKQVCPYCSHSRYSKKYHHQKRVKETRDDGSIRWRWYNPRFEYKCKKCKLIWSKGLPMRY